MRSHGRSSRQTFGDRFRAAWGHCASSVAVVGNSITRGVATGARPPAVRRTELACDTVVTPANDEAEITRGGDIAIAVATAPGSAAAASFGPCQGWLPAMYRSSCGVSPCHGALPATYRCEAAPRGYSSATSVRISMSTYAARSTRRLSCAASELADESPSTPATEAADEPPWSASCASPRPLPGSARRPPGCGAPARARRRAAPRRSAERERRRRRRLPAAGARLSARPQA